MFAIFPGRRAAGVHRVELRGGLNTVGLIDDGVHRPAGPWSSSVHALLRHVSAAGSAAAPVPFGFDAEGREVCPPCRVKLVTALRHDRMYRAHAAAVPDPHVTLCTG
jgi:hypothetical protein